jgi:hypothetical protein
VRAPLLLRIPEWAAGAAVRVGSEGAVDAAPGTFHRVEREWRGRTVIEISFPMRPTLWRGDRGAVAVRRGPLVFSLRIGEDWRRINAGKEGRELPHGDWEVHPTTPWNYGLLLREDRLNEDVRFTERPVGDMPFSQEGAPVAATARARRLPQWRNENGSAQEVPEGDITSSEPLQDVTLLPYGCTRLRITEFPVLDR